MAGVLKDKLIEVGRWIAVLPGGILCGLLILFPLHWILYFTLVKGDIIQMPVEDMGHIERFLSPIISSMIFVYAGAMIAPKKRFIVSIILFVLGILIRIGLIFIVRLSDIKLDASLYGLSRLLLSALAGGIGVLFVYIAAKNKERII